MGVVEGAPSTLDGNRLPGISSLKAGFGGTSGSVKPFAGLLRNSFRALASVCDKPPNPRNVERLVDISLPNKDVPEESVLTDAEVLNGDVLEVGGITEADVPNGDVL